MMGYIPPKEPTFHSATATLYTIANLTDVGSQYLAQSGVRVRPRQDGYQKYLADLYGGRGFDTFLIWNYALLAWMIAVVVLIIAAVSQ